MSIQLHHWVYNVYKKEEFVNDYRSFPHDVTARSLVYKTTNGGYVSVQGKNPVGID